MKNSIIKINRVVESEYTLLREPTKEELEMIKDSEIFDIDGLVDWNNEMIINEDYSYNTISIFVDDKIIFKKDGGIVHL